MKFKKKLLIFQLLSFANLDICEDGVLKFHRWISHPKITNTYFLVWIISLYGVMPILKGHNDFFFIQCISKAITDRSFKLCQLIKDNE